MDSVSSFVVSQEEFVLFHKMDRELYEILVFHLSREPGECMQVFAMWFWLERVGFRNLVKKIMALPNILISEVADETVQCLSCINNSLIIPSSSSSSSSSDSSDIPLLQGLLDKEISLHFFYEKRVEALQGVAKMMQEVCLRAFTDIMQQAMLRIAAERMVEMTQNSENSFWFGSIGPSNLRVTKVGGGGDGAENNEVVPADDRTLFVTFSKGYHVAEWEVREFFTVAYGDCIEALHMQEVQPNEQPLFARIVFHKICTIDMILKGATKAKFTINGKHVWARKFVPKRTATKSLISSLPNLPGEASVSGL